MTELHEKVGKIDAKVDVLLDRTKGFDNRLRTVEHRQWWASGAAAVAGFFVSHFMKGPV
jgi:hypothetical protein